VKSSHLSRRVARHLLLGGLSVCTGLPAACARNSTVLVASVPGRADGAAPDSTHRAATGPGWRIETREHLDLWLHGFAMLQNDSSLVPYYRLDYATEVRQARGAATSLLDTNAPQLRARLAANPALVSAQFLALYFASWEDLRRGCDRFLRDGGDVARAGDNETARMYATLRTYFPTAADRDWLQLFVRSLDDERARFFRAWWLQQQQLRASARARVESLWRDTYRAPFARFMNNALEREGVILLSVPLAGEGRTLSLGPRDSFIAVEFPRAGDDPREALFAVAHEAVGAVATTSVRDNSSPSDERSGDVAKWSTLAAVRGGAMLLQRVAPDMVEGYERYYLSLARQPPASAAAELGSQFARIFPLPDPILAALQRQIDIVLNGI
jgi:hypothetical protein